MNIDTTKTTVPEIEGTGKNVFRCTVCGHYYKTDERNMPLEYKCPVCGSHKAKFEKLDLDPEKPDDLGAGR